jgi:hypothetical protein
MRLSQMYGRMDIQFVSLLESGSSTSVITITAPSEQSPSQSSQSPTAC